MLEKWRIWRRINWKQYRKENTEIRDNFWVLEQVRGEDVSIKKEKKRANVATIRRTKPIVASVLQYCSNRKIGFSASHESHTPLPDEGNKPMMDVAQNLQTLGVHALADMQTWYVRTQNWYEHVAASICADEEALLTVAQRPSCDSETYPGTETKTGTGTETDSCQ